MDYMREIPMVISLYFLWRWNNESVDETNDEVVQPKIWDYCHLIILIMARAFVVGVKYGTFSDQYFYIYRHVKLP